MKKLALESQPYNQNQMQKNTFYDFEISYNDSKGKEQKKEDPI